MVNVQLKELGLTASVGEKWTREIDNVTWLELSILCEQLIDNLGLILPRLELMSKEDTHTRTLLGVSLRGHKALRKFARRWAELEEHGREEGRARSCGLS